MPGYGPTIPHNHDRLDAPLGSNRTISRRAMERPDFTVLSDSLLRAVAPPCDVDKLMEFLAASNQRVCFLRNPVVPFGGFSDNPETRPLEEELVAGRERDYQEDKRAFDNFKSRHPKVDIRVLEANTASVEHGGYWVRDYLGWVAEDTSPVYIPSCERRWGHPPPLANVEDLVGGEVVWPDGGAILTDLSLKRLQNSRWLDMPAGGIEEIFKVYGRKSVVIPSIPFVDIRGSHADLLVGCVNNTLLVPTLFPPPSSLELAQDGFDGSEWLRDHLEETGGIYPIIKLGRRPDSRDVIPAVQQALDDIARQLESSWNVIRIPTPAPLGNSAVQQAYMATNGGGFASGLSIDEDDLDLLHLPFEEELKAVGAREPWWTFFSTANVISRRTDNGDLNVAVPWPRIHEEALLESYDPVHVEWLRAFAKARDQVEAALKLAGATRVFFIPCDLLGGGVRCLSWELTHEIICASGSEGNSPGRILADW